MWYNSTVQSLSTKINQAKLMSRSKLRGNHNKYTNKQCGIAYKLISESDGNNSDVVIVGSAQRYVSDNETVLCCVRCLNDELYSIVTTLIRFCAHVSITIII